MTASQLVRIPVPADINHLRRGNTYQATTYAGRTIVGEYLGIEVPYGDRSILLRSQAGTESIMLDQIDSIEDRI